MSDGQGTHLSKLDRAQGAMIVSMAAEIMESIDYRFSGLTNSSKVRVAVSVGGSPYTALPSQAFAPWVHRSPLVLGGELVQYAPTEPLVDGWELVQPLPVVLERSDDEWYIVSESEFLVYGTGTSPKEAIHDYVVSLAEYFQLVRDSAVSNPFDKGELRHLKSYLRSPEAH